MLIDQANDLLKPGYLPFESGYKRLDNGQMLGWWFAREKTLEDFKRWHPVEHVDWRSEGEVSFPVHLRNGELLKGRVRSRQPSAYLDEELLRSPAVSVVSCAQLGLAEADFWTGLIIHAGRDTDYGCEVKSRFWLGAFDPPDRTPPIAVLQQLFTDERGEQLLRHTMEEFKYLAGFLPELFARDGLARKPL